MEFDALAYAATENLFNGALRARMELPSLIEELEGQYALHCGLSEYVGRSALTDGQEALLDHIEKHEHLLSLISREIEALNETSADARAVLSHMEDPMDATLLRLRYLCGEPERRIVKMEVDGEKVWQYSDRYIYERKAIALVRASAVVRALGLVAKYSK